jgi:hypothetical protein
MELNFVIDKENLKNYKPVAPYVSIPAPTAYLMLGQDSTKQPHYQYTASDPRYYWSPIYVDTMVEQQFNPRWFCAEHWWRIRCNHPNHQYLLALDCDSEQDMLSAARILKIHDIGYAIVKTSVGNDITVIKGTQLVPFPQGPQGIQGVQGVQAVYPSLITEQQLTDHFWVLADYIAPMKHLINFMRTVPGVDEKFVACCDYKQTIHLRAHPKGVSLPVFPTSHTLTSKRAIEWYEAFKNHFESPKMKAVLVARKLQSVKNKPDEFSKMIHDPSFEV